jgi:hypothetical protein
MPNDNMPTNAEFAQMSADEAQAALQKVPVHLRRSVLSADGWIAPAERPDAHSTVSRVETDKLRG